MGILLSSHLKKKINKRFYLSALTVWYVTQCPCMLQQTKITCLNPGRLQGCAVRLAGWNGKVYPVYYIKPVLGADQFIDISSKFQRGYIVIFKKPDDKVL